MFTTVREAEKPALRPDFEANARLRLRNRIAASEASVTNRQDKRPIWRIETNTQNGNRRFAMSWLLVIGMIATLLTGGGVAYASNDALPGDALYQVKNSLQEMQLAFNGDEQDAELLLQFMHQNIGEVQQLMAQERYGDVLTGLEAYQQHYQALVQAQNRLSSEDALAGESLNTRIQERLQDQTQLLIQLHEQIRDQLKDQQQLQDNLQDKLQEAIQLTEAGKTYGPNDGGQPEEPGTPNGAGPGEPQGPQEEPAQNGQPDDAGGTGPKDDAGGTGPKDDAGSGSDDAGTGGDGSSGEGPGEGSGEQPGDSGGNGQGGKP